ncbi:MAG: hypothetical protein VW226_13085 [Rhodospirillaceae bacterium]
MTPIIAFSKFYLRNTIFLCAIVFYTTFIIMNSWFADDALIAFRTIDNFVNRNGLRFNLGERVAVFTNPAWVFILSLGYWISGQLFLATTALSLLITLTFVAFLLKISVSHQNRVVVFLMLLSPTMLFYASSGMENPLSHLLIVGFLYCFYNLRDSRQCKTIVISLLASLIYLARPDAILITAPFLLMQLVDNLNAVRRGKFGSIMALRCYAVGFSPIIAWTLFAIAYFGFPFPNSFYAKAYAHIPSSINWNWGTDYFLQADLGFFVVSGVLLASILFGRQLKLMPLAIGIVIHVYYIVSVGGDYPRTNIYHGRLFSVDFAALLFYLSQLNITLRWFRKICLLGILALAALLNHVDISIAECRLRCIDLVGHTVPYPVIRPEKYADIQWDFRLLFDEEGRKAFTVQRTTGQKRFDLPFASHPSYQPHKIQERLRRISFSNIDNNYPKEVLVAPLGRNGLFAHPQTTVLDYYALSDSAIARMPVSVPLRSGHYRREINLNNADRRYSAQLRDVVSGAIWTRTRWKAIAESNFDDFRRSPKSAGQEIRWPFVNAMGTTNTLYHEGVNAVDSGRLDDAACLFAMSALGGYWPGRSALAIMFESGIGVSSSIDVSRALRARDQNIDDALAAIRGDESNIRLHECLEEHVKTRGLVNIEQERYWANAGLIEGAYNLGSMLSFQHLLPNHEHTRFDQKASWEDGGFARDLEEGIKWLRVAAEAGHASAMNNLGLAYAFRRQDGDRDKAIRNLELAIEGFSPFSTDPQVVRYRSLAKNNLAQIRDWVPESSFVR